MKVLWLCNCPLTDSEDGTSGTWLDAMARGLLDSTSVELGIIAFGEVRRFTRQDYRNVKQWLVPGSVERSGLPPNSVIQFIVSSVNDFSPDVIHVWGSEYFWGLLLARGLLTYPTLLEMQGLKGPASKVFCGGLTRIEQMGCIGIKEMLKRRTMHADQRDFARWDLREREIIRGHQFVAVQTSWITAQVRAINPGARLFASDLVLRQPFYETAGWQASDRKSIFCSAGYAAPFKGVHVAIRALSLLRKRTPEACLRIAGPLQRTGIRQVGYIRWVNRLVRELGLGDVIKWLGPLNAEQVVSELENAAVVVIPSFIENCCTSMQEAMAIGTPVVVSYVGGLPSIGHDEDSCLFFPPGDNEMCAYQLERVLTDPGLSRRLSMVSREIAKGRNERNRIIERQLETYRLILAHKKQH